MGLLPLVRSRIVVKLTLTLVGFVALAALAAGLYLNRALETFAVEMLQTRLATAGHLLQDEARALIAEGASPARVHDFVTRAAQATDARVTLIALDGRVIGESDLGLTELERMENHAQRPEVRAARAGRVGSGVRRSATLDTPLLYVAVPVRDAGRVTAVLRLALPLATVTASYAPLHGVMLVGGLVALAVACGIGVFVARRVTRPVLEMERIARRMADGAFDVRTPVRSADELGALARALNTMAARLREKIDDLEHERARVGAILDGMVEGVIAVDGHDHVVLSNERARAMFELAASPEGKPFLEAIRNADLHDVLYAARATAEGAVLARELRLPAATERVLQVNAVPLRLGRDETGIVMVLHDITELRRLERVRTEFVANVSHELRTPLTAILGYVETLLGGALDDPANARKFLEVVGRHSERLGRLVDDLTDLSNIELGKVTLQLAPTRLAEVVESVLAIIRPRAGSKRLAITTAVADAPAVLADHDRLAQILINLVDNAVKYTPDGGAIAIAARARNGMVEVSIADTGVGIPRGELPRVTERFYRVDKARSRELGGTGLGLAIVKHLVQAHSGELTIESEPGRGTTVKFTLPAAG